MCLAIPGQILSIDDAEPLFRQGTVSFGGITKTISLACTPEARVGDYVLVHVGLAISIIDEDQAARVFEVLQELDDLAELKDGTA